MVEGVHQTVGDAPHVHRLGEAQRRLPPAAALTEARQPPADGQRSLQVVEELPVEADGEGRHLRQLVVVVPATESAEGDSTSGQEFSQNSSQKSFFDKVEDPLVQKLMATLEWILTGKRSLFLIGGIAENISLRLKT